MKDLITRYETKDGTCYIRLATDAIPAILNCDREYEAEHFELSENNKKFDNALTLSNVLDFLLDENTYSEVAKWESYYNPWFQNATSFRKTMSNLVYENNVFQDCLCAWISINDSISIIQDPSNNNIFYIHEDVYRMIDGNTAKS